MGPWANFMWPSARDQHNPRASQNHRPSRVGTQSPHFSGRLGCAFGGYDLACTWVGHLHPPPPPQPAREGEGVCLWNQHKARFASSVSTESTWPCDSYLCPPTNDYPLLAFPLPDKLFQPQMWSLPIGFLTFWLSLSFSPHPWPPACFVLCPYRAASFLQGPWGLTSLACCPAFLVQPTSPASSSSLQSIQGSRLPGTSKRLEHLGCILISSCSHTLAKTSGLFSSPMWYFFQVPG